MAYKANINTNYEDPDPRECSRDGSLVFEVSKEGIKEPRMIVWVMKSQNPLDPIYTQEVFRYLALAKERDLKIEAYHNGRKVTNKVLKAFEKGMNIDELPGMIRGKRYSDPMDKFIIDL